MESVSWLHDLIYVHGAQALEQSDVWLNTRRFGTSWQAALAAGRGLLFFLALFNLWNSRVTAQGHRVFRWTFRLSLAALVALGMVQLPALYLHDQPRSPVTIAILINLYSISLLVFSITAMIRYGQKRRRALEGELSKLAPPQAVREPE